MPPNRTTEFVNDLINREDKVTGFHLTKNRFLILFYKCLYIRRGKKISTLFEVLYPILIFYFSLNHSNSILKIDKVPENLNNNSFGQTSGQIAEFRKLKYFHYNPIYYGYNNVSVDLAELKYFINSSFHLDRIKFNLVKSQEEIKESSYFFVYFKNLNSTCINYSISIINDIRYSFDWFYPYFNVSLDRRPIDIFHQILLQAHLTKLSSSAKNYKVKFKNFDISVKTDFSKDKGFQNPNLFIVYPNVLFLSFALVFHFILTSICEEKLTRSFEFLKLMGASDGEILLGHFLNHFLFWIFPLIVNTIILIRFVPSAILPTNVVIIFIIFSTLYIVHLICFLILISTPFKKYIYPEIIFVLLFFSIASNSVTNVNTTDKKNSLISRVFYLFHPYGIISELSTIGKTLSNKFTFEENFFELFTYRAAGDLSFFFVMMISIFFIIFEIMLTNYILQVNPFQNGIRKPFFYFLSSDYWLGNTPITDFSMPDKKEFEKPPLNKRASIILKDIYKSYVSWFCFGSFRVLKNFNFAIYEKQITVLLGHNGAGKTTTMDLITGLSVPDSGSVTVQGITVSPYTNKFKRALGYCPQENIFYEKLTVFQNLKIAGILKGVSLDKIERKISHLVVQFDLESKLNLKAEKLSGGMKRRLCLAIAIIGYNDVLVIDEPTSGLDAQNRRKVWDILLELRKHRTILLTTHFLEEADILGDTIAIMHDGNVKCCGSTIFLKKIYNIGYRLRLELNKIPDETLLLQTIQDHVPHATFMNKHENEYFYRLSLDESKSEANLNLMIANLFDYFDKQVKRQSMGIKTYGLTSTSLEDVFIKIGTLDQPEEEQVTIEHAEDHPLFNLCRIGGFKLYLQQLTAIFKKKFILTYKNLQLFISSIYPLILPTIIICLLGFITKIINDVNIQTFYSSEINKNIGKMDVLLLANQFNDSNYLFREANRKWLIDEFGFSRFIESKEIKIDSAVNEEKNKLGWPNFSKKYCLIIERNDNLSYTFYLNPLKLPYNLMGSIEIFFRSLAREIDPKSDFKVDYMIESLSKTTEDYKDDGRADNLSLLLIYGNLCKIIISSGIGIMFSFSVIVFVEILNEEMNSGALDMQIIAGLSKKIYWFGHLMFDYIFYLVLVLISCISICIFDKNEIISVHIGHFFIAFSLASLNCLLITYFVVNLKMRREITDFIIKYSLLIACFAIGIYDVIYFATNLGGSKSLPYGFFLMILSPPYNFIDQFFKYYDIYVQKWCLEMIKKEDECKLFDSRRFDFKYNSIAYLISISLFTFLIILINFNIHFVMRLVESFNNSWFKFKKSMFKKKRNEAGNEGQLAATLPKRDINVNYLADIKDPNVDKEAQLAQILVESNSFQNNILVVQNLVKMFSGFTAVDNLSFTVKREECFGLLGINGAGKTTTFKMIGGSIMPTSGTILIDGYTFDLNPYEYYRKLGYCPQDNTHTNRITVSDNLRFYARINGIPGYLIKKSVQTLIEECDLEQHKNKFAETLSGGNKRKLSTAIALIGKKDLILLDEPTTGVDPVARRKLWKTLEFYKKQLQTSFILTSHSMDECERLCNKISIMVAGKFRCLGTFSYLRDTYSQGFTITIKIKDNLNEEPYISNLKERMNNDLQEKAKMKEFYMNTMVFIILSKAFNWSQLFRAMEKIKTDFNLDDYLISDTNLEQIFLSFAEANDEK